MILTNIYRKIKEYDTIIIHRHIKPDGDALGSQIGLKESLIATFPNKCIKVVGDMSERYSFIGEMDEIEDSLYEDALVIVLDTGAERLISDERYKLGKYLIKIDHHLPQGEYGDLAYVDTSRESCAGVVASFLMEKRFKINDKVATALFTGMVTDSGRFRYQSTSSTTYKIASELMKYNIDTESIYNKIYVDKLANVKLKAKLIDKFIVLDSGVAYLINTKEEIKEYNVPIYDVSRGMVNIMAGIEEIKIWANFSEDENGDIYCEIRSNGPNINVVATKYGGGGHLQASGTTIYSFDTVKEIINDLERVARGEECL
jgi:phosphoesterase RecJ-like protein